MFRRALAAAAAAVAAAALVPVVAHAKDDPAAVKAARDAVRKDFTEKRKCFPYLDLSYYVDVPALKDSRWSQVAIHDPKEDDGAQLHAVWEATTGAEDGPKITVIVQKFPHFKQVNASQRAPFQMEFKAWGKAVETSKVDEMAQGFYEEWTRSSSDVVKEKCQPPKKSQVGPAKFFATAVATDKDTKQRERRDWYVWVTQKGIPCTWVAILTYTTKVLEKEEHLQRGEDFMKYTKELTDGRLK